MSPVNTVKRFALKSILATGGVPMPGGALNDACRALAPGMLHSDFLQVLRELEEGGFIVGAMDELDGTASWTLTTKGELKARQL